MQRSPLRDADWLLVYSSHVPAIDKGGGFYNGLLNLHPCGHPQKRHLWTVPELASGVTDFRVSCTTNSTCQPLESLAHDRQDFSVDMAFYATLWYQMIASGLEDEDTCFMTPFMQSSFFPPRRCDLLTGRCIAEGVPWRSHAWGETICDDPDTFSLSLDGSWEASSPTRWGMNDALWVCGTDECPTDRDVCAWFIWVRKSEDPRDKFDRGVGLIGWPLIASWILGAVISATMPILACLVSFVMFRLCDILASGVMGQPGRVMH